MPKLQNVYTLYNSMCGLVTQISCVYDLVEGDLSF